MAGELIVLGNPVPLPIRIGIGLLGVITIMAGLYHARLRLRRSAAYRNGLALAGRVAFEGTQGEEADVARILFSAGGRHWRMTVDRRGAEHLIERPSNTVPAIAWLGKNDIVYAIDADGRSLLPISPGREVNPANSAPPLYQRNQKV
ncbi:hypothetical protein ELI_09870 [Erythrobacter litoralis HTCC2594]|uniref:Uncharacterized protein n=1 Tax=Erythrobacter litoralis (strain HTCC2594) TaxID=314225 RepID=Q2N8C5_ERYLH|nr:hypothetical protein ELI_09870 [Erythrobacter litoralis HTCC2594]